MDNNKYEGIRFINGISNIVNNSYSFINKSTFYMCANSTFINYYQTKIIPISQWIDGYVPGFHSLENGIFSTRLANTIINTLSTLIYDQRLFFKSENSDTINGDNIKLDLQRIETWSKKSNFQNALKNTIKYSLGLGTSLFKLNRDLDGSLWCEALSLDSFWFKTNLRQNKITECTCLIKTYVNNLNREDTQGKVENFYLVERRYFKKKIIKQGYKDNEGKLGVKVEVKDIPYSTLEVYRSGVNVLVAPNVDGSSQRMNWSSLPNWLKRSLKEDYGIIILGEEKLLPFVDNLGLFLFKHGSGDITLPNIPFGTSILENIIAYLPAWDMVWSYKIRDMYQGKGIILVPVGWTKGNPQNMVNSPFNGLDEGMLYKYQTTNDRENKPDKIQFDLRVSEWQQSEDDILRKIASSLGISASTLASYLNASSFTGNKTATEVDSDYQQTISFINVERENYTDLINTILHTVCIYLNTHYNVQAQFATPIQVSIDRIVDRQIKLIVNGLTTPADAIKEIYPNENTTQYEDRLNRLETYKNEQMEKESLQNVALYQGYQNGFDIDNANGTMSTNNMKSNNDKNNEAYNEHNRKEMINKGNVLGGSLGEESKLG